MFTLKKITAQCLMYALLKLGHIFKFFRFLNLNVKIEIDHPTSGIEHGRERTASSEDVPEDIAPDDTIRSSTHSENLRSFVTGLFELSYKNLEYFRLPVDATCRGRRKYFRARCTPNSDQYTAGPAVDSCFGFAFLLLRTTQRLNINMPGHVRIYRS